VLGTFGPRFARAGPPDSPDYPGRRRALSKQNAPAPACDGRRTQRRAGPGSDEQRRPRRWHRCDEPGVDGRPPAPRLTRVLRFGRVACL